MIGLHCGPAAALKPLAMAMALARPRAAAPGPTVNKGVSKGVSKGLGDADERLRLARWCSVNGLIAEALVEARAATRMRPGFAAAERFAVTL